MLELLTNIGQATGAKFNDLRSHAVQNLQSFEFDQVWADLVDDMSDEIAHSESSESAFADSL